ncbi:type IV toxin-antitoxin system AbiEi family antitoxin domain-containing protein [Nocardioides hankookensis]|uniref:Type IV toxin-antitoxin system AbiEi family antitoxin domain-containing protein n=1 Tax=Nocardioides hankookensis TaxID=443157 RepID=A0ABW1LJR0_9ACTN
MRYLLVDEYGLLLRRTALTLGLDDNWLARMLRLGVLVRIRHGAYADADVWQQLTPAGRHLLLSRAVMLQYDDRVALSHASAHVMRGGPDWGLDLEKVNVTNLFGRGDRVQAGITHHRGTTRVSDVSRLNGHWVTAPGRTAVETAAGLELVAAVCVLDWTLHQGLTTREELERYATVWLREWPGSIELPVAVARSDGRSESVGETRSRIALENLGFEPEPQWAVHHPSGRLAGRVDLLLRRQGVMVEFDGWVKYGRLLKPGQTITDVIKAERDREVLLEELTGLRMLRLVWADLQQPAEIGSRVARIVSHRRAS